MTFKPDRLSDFRDVFVDSAPKIRAFEGCRHLELWRDADDSAVRTTHSHWTDAHALAQYRQSSLFASTWSTVKPMFAARPAAHSYVVARSAAVIDAAAGDDGDPA